jgi:hypothetical protein
VDGSVSPVLEGWVHHRDTEAQMKKGLLTTESTEATEKNQELRTKLRDLHVLSLP